MPLDTSISDLWWLQPHQTSDSRAGFALGAQMAQAAAENQLKERQFQYSTVIKNAAMRSQVEQGRGMAQLSAHMATVAEQDAWDQPWAQKGFWDTFAANPELAGATHPDTLWNNTFVRHMEFKEKANQISLREDRLRQDAEDRTVARFRDLEIKAARAEIYGRRTDETADYHAAQQAFKEAQAETDNALKLKKLDIANRLADVAESRAATYEAIGQKRAEFFDARIKQMEQGLAPGLATAYHAHATAIRDKWQFSSDPKAMEKAQEELKRLDDEYGVKKTPITPVAPVAPAAAPPGTPAPAPAAPKDPLGLFK